MKSIFLWISIGSIVWSIALVSAEAKTNTKFNQESSIAVDSLEEGKYE